MKSEFWINFKIFAKLKTLKKCCNTADNLELCDFEEPTTTTTTKATTTTTLSTTVTMTTSTKKTTTTTTTTTMITNDESSTTPTTTTSTTTEACEETFQNLDKMLFIFKPLTLRFFGNEKRIIQLTGEVLDSGEPNDSFKVKIVRICY